MFNIGDRVKFGQSVGTVIDGPVTYRTDISKSEYYTIHFDGRKTPEYRMEEYQLTLI